MTGRLRAAFAYGLVFARRYGLSLAIVFACVLLPLWGFAELADEVHEQEDILFDEPLLRWMHLHSSPALDALFVMLSKLGYQWGVVPASIALVLVLFARRRLPAGLFAGLAVLGSALVNMGAKHWFARTRPTLWESIAPEGTFSFPSGHAMGSMTLAVTLVLLCWRAQTPAVRRWRVPFAVAVFAFVLLVGASRVYLGVHYPSDILAGWAASIAWVVGMHRLVARFRPRPAELAAAAS